jgi:hypothetical protein
MYGFGMAVDVLVRGGKDRAAPADKKPDPPTRFEMNPSGLLLPTGTA